MSLYIASKTLWRIKVWQLASHRIFEKLSRSSIAKVCYCLIAMATYNMDRAVDPQSSSPISRVPIVDVLCQFQKLCAIPSSAMEATDEMPAENNADWILDSLVAYLQGPIWITPILNFMEQKSVGVLKIQLHRTTPFSDRLNSLFCSKFSKVTVLNSRMNIEESTRSFVI